MYWDIKSLREWAENIFTAKIAQTINSICKVEVERMMNDPGVISIPKDKEEIVLAADILSAKKRQEEFEQMIASEPKIPSH